MPEQKSPFNNFNLNLKGLKDQTKLVQVEAKLDKPSPETLLKRTFPTGIAIYRQFIRREKGLAQHELRKESTAASVKNEVLNSYASISSTIEGQLGVINAYYSEILNQYMLENNINKDARDVASGELKRIKKEFGLGEYIAVCQNLRDRHEKEGIKNKAFELKAQLESALQEFNRDPENSAILVEENHSDLSLKERMICYALIKGQWYSMTYSGGNSFKPAEVRSRQTSLEYLAKKITSPSNFQIKSISVGKKPYSQDSQKTSQQADLSLLTN